MSTRISQDRKHGMGEEGGDNQAELELQSSPNSATIQLHYKTAESAFHVVVAFVLSTFKVLGAKDNAGAHICQLRVK